VFFKPRQDPDVGQAERPPAFENQPDLRAADARSRLLAEASGGKNYQAKRAHQA
jgi:hypothetical protein